MKRKQKRKAKAKAKTPAEVRSKILKAMDRSAKVAERRVARSSSYMNAVAKMRNLEGSR